MQRNRRHTISETRNSRRWSLTACLFLLSVLPLFVRQLLLIFSVSWVAESRVRVSTDGGTEPLWSHGGSELFYRNRNGDLVVATTPGFVVRQREVLFPYAGDVQSDNAHLFAVLPDDQRFVVIRAAGSGGLATHGDLVLVENWMEEVKAQGRN